MIVFRLVRKERALDALSGKGAAKWGARWNIVGQRAVYTSDSLALACIETVVHIASPTPPESVYFRLEIPDDRIRWLDMDELPSVWDDQGSPIAVQDFGTDLLQEFERSRKTWGFVVPSITMPHSYNLVLAPDAVAAASPLGLTDFAPDGPQPFYYDPRLFL